ncbi:MAG: aspartyl protease family protein [Reichenbachiella sp.]
MKQLKTILLTCALVMYLADHCSAQHMGFQFPEGMKKVRMDFELHNNLIVIPVVINESIKLKFILDTGVQYPILTERFFADVLGLEYTRRILVQSPGTMDSLTALVCTDVKIALPGGITSGFNQALLVLEKDYLRLRENMGEEIYGIIGYDIFSRFVVEIDYQDKHLTLYEPSAFSPKKQYTKIEMKTYNTKPYVKLNLTNQNHENLDLLFMIDTGASHTLLLNNYEGKNILPATTISSVIGRGLGGQIHGNLGRVDIVSIGDFEFEQPILTFPLEGHYGSPISRGSRNGTIGSGFLSRFDVVIDYFSESLYIRKNSNFNRPFEYDMSGITLMLDDQNYEQFIVNYVRVDSPADLAGVQQGDIISTINGYSYKDLKLGDANSILRHRDGKKIVVKIIRGELEFKTTFRLQRYI